MKRHTRILSQLVTIIAVLAISAMQVVPVLADDEAPPPPPATEVVDPAAGEVVPPPEENPSPEAPPADVPAEVPTIDVEEVPIEAAPAATEAPVVEAPAVEEVAPTEPAPLATEVPAEVAATAPAEAAPAEDEQPAAEPETPAEILAQVPAGTELVVLDENGEALPLVTEEAAEILTGGDPQWCPVGVAPGGAGCSPSGNTSFQALIDWLIANDPNKAGVIWIEDDYDSSTAVGDGGITNFSLSGADFVHLDNFALTIKGGWTGSGIAIDTSNPSVFSGDSLSIVNWNGAITLSDIVINDVSGATALTVETTKDITVTRVEVGTASDPNTINGAYLTNSSGTGNVTITNSKFSYNTGGTGVYVVSAGAITLSGVSANHNGVYGAVFDNRPAATAKNVTLTSGILEFNDNGGTGLTILSDGAVSLKDITATGNGADGAIVNNQSGTAAITLTGTNIFSENAVNGVTLLSRRAITASNLIANANTGGYGATISNTAAGTSVNVGVTLTGSNQFNFNGGGLSIATLGAITLNNLSATGNTSSYGALLQNSGSPFNSAVKLTGTNLFNDNYNTGLSITSRGAVTLNNVTANSNGTAVSLGRGAVINNQAAPTAQAVTLTGVNTFNDNYGGGLRLLSRGAITLNKVTADDNTAGGGVLLNNAVSPTAPQNVIVNGYIITNRNNDFGLLIESYGSILLNNVTAIDNSLNGAWLNNGGSAAPKTVTLSGNNTFNSNTQYGLVVNSRGAITVNNLTADSNGSYGASLYNAYADAVGGITVNNTSTFSPSVSYNGDGGIVATSNGTILIKDLNAIGNGISGGVLDNTTGAAGNVSVGTSRLNWCNHFASNNDSGLEILSNGIVTLSNLCNDGNGDGTDPSPYGYGLLVDNSSAATPKAVTLLGTNTFNNNYNGGLSISSDGAITLNKVTASENRNGFGAVIDNKETANPLVPQNVTLNGYGNFSDNTSLGLTLVTYGAITLNNLSANGNSATGIYIVNDLGSLARNVTINGFAESSNNSLTGLYIYSHGIIKVANLNANGNGSMGADLVNGDGNGTVTLTGHAWANDNAGLGLWVVSNGSISIANLSTWGNGNDGTMLTNNAVGSTGTVTLTGSASASNNAGGGIVILSNRAITISNLTSERNGATGAWLNNSTSTSASPQNITILGYGKLSGNGDEGLDVDTYGVITLNNITANDNGWGGGGYGAVLDNFQTNGTTPKAVLLNGTNTFNNNTSVGLSVDTLGAITASNLIANGNAGTGVYLDNCQLLGACRGTGNITITGVNMFSGNGSDGLYVYSKGVVNLTKITANDNGDDGLTVITRNNITLTCGSMTGNASAGWVLSAAGSPNLVTLKGVFAYGNGNNTQPMLGTFVYTRACPLP